MNSLRQALERQRAQNDQAYDKAAADQAERIRQRAAAAKPPAHLSQASSPLRQVSPDQPVCQECNGIGWISRNVLDVTDPDFGKAFPCICQRAEIERKRFARLFGDAGIPERHKAFDFTTFLPYLCEKNTLAYQYSQVLATGQMIEAEEMVKPGLLLWGRFGVGKTGLAAAVIKARLGNGEAALWVDYSRFISRVQRTYSGDQDVQGTDIVNAAASAPFAVIDDLGDYDRGNKAVSDDQRRITYEVISARHEKVLPTMITTNLEPGAFEAQFGARIYQRVLELCHIVPMGGGSLRR